MSSDRTEKVHFQFNLSKSKDKSVPLQKTRKGDASFPFATQGEEEPLNHSIADAAAAQTARRREEGTHLIIPLASNSTTSRLLRNDPTQSLERSPPPSTDWDAIQAITQEATTNNNLGSDTIQKRSSLSIPISGDMDKIQFQQDVAQRAEELTVDSSAYIQVPIAEFGAAMLRGMGWKEENKETKPGISSNDVMQPRHARLGLGALPKIMGQEPSAAVDDRPFRRGQVHLDTVQHQRQELEQVVNRQKIIQVGSIVWVHAGEEMNCKDIQRARVEKTSGVPGLNRVLVQFENTLDKSYSIDRKKLHLVSIEELDQKPFVDLNESTQRIRDSPSSPSRADGLSHGKKRSHKELDDTDPKHVTRDDNDGKKKKKKNKGSERNEMWLLPHIRVRIVSAKVKNGKFFKEKGVVVDVLRGGTEAMVQMDNGTLLEYVPERYLATALPKVGGRVMILQGPFRHSQGTLLERHSHEDRGVIQLDCDLTVMSLPLDDVAEYCGSHEF